MYHNYINVIIVIAMWLLTELEELVGRATRWVSPSCVRTVSQSGMFYYLTVGACSVESLSSANLIYSTK